MTPRHTLALVLLVAGAAALLLAALALAVLPGPYLRLHALSPAAALGAPLVALALAVDTGPGRAAVKLLVIGLLLAIGGTVTTMAVARTTVRAERKAQQ
ncbi:monovalent cation/H(+) antiporter subunit G [Streptomyces viridifaciens]|uniref:cation:proton antiporter n=1 Tax=Kitasatospora aureofaciens TaxID=1894 RepID=UPI0004BEE267|nr:monovalent cation/H(+) antiporter subunit G [Kitasatospora aureofaciens]UKZ10479.1 monovalent cation/H(+) antiporter subunit G [Streptomyces viridifaciens]